MATKELQFCENCSNMLYLRQSNTGGGRLIDVCRRCGFEGTPVESAEDIVIYEKSYERGFIRPRVDVIAFLDPAVPSTKEISCPNEACPSRQADGPEPKARYIVLNPETYSILYRCEQEGCGKVWKNKN